MPENIIPSDKPDTPLDACRSLAWEAVRDLTDRSPNDRPLEVMSVDDAAEWLTRFLCRAYIEGQRYVVGQ